MQVKFQKRIKQILTKEISAVDYAQKGAFSARFGCDIPLVTNSCCANWDTEGEFHFFVNFFGVNLEVGVRLQVVPASA